MDTPVVNTSKAPKLPLRLLLLTGLLVGTLDISAAFISSYLTNGSNPGAVLKYIASGVFGMSAFKGGIGMMLWGLLFHFIIACSFTFLFYWLYTRIKFVRSQPVISAILYGVFMWIVTTKIIMPLSNTPPAAKFNIWKALKAIAILCLMISLPLTLIIGSYYKKLKK